MHKSIATRLTACMIPYEIKEALLKEADCSISKKRILGILKRYNSQDLLDEAIDFLYPKYESIRMERKAIIEVHSQELEQIKTENQCSLLSEDTRQVLADFIDKHKNSHKYLPHEYVDTFKPLNLDKNNIERYGSQSNRQESNKF